MLHLVGQLISISSFSRRQLPEVEKIETLDLIFCVWYFGPDVTATEQLWLFLKLGDLIDLLAYDDLR